MLCVENFANQWHLFCCPHLSSFYIVYFQNFMNKIAGYSKTSWWKRISWVQENVWTLPCDRIRSCRWVSTFTVSLKARDVTHDSTFMFWINVNDYACVIVSQYRSALKSNNIVVVMPAYSYWFQLLAGSSTRNESEI